MVGERAALVEVKTHDGRRLAVETTGAPDGLPVFLMHGTPGSRAGIKPRNIVLYRQGIQLICYDRPGYGLSDRQQGRSVVDAARDVEAIADELAIDRFAVVGRSGGGPHALAVAAMLPDRVTRAAILVSLAPADAPGLDWYQGMSESNTSEYRGADADHVELMSSLMSRADGVRRDPESLLAFLEREVTAADRRVIDDVAMRSQLTASYAEAVRYGADGWIDDALAFRCEWGFDLASIVVPVRLWHGAADQFSPVEHTRWLASRIPGAEFEVAAGQGHFGAVEILPRMLAWLTTGPAAVAAFVRADADRGPGASKRLR